MSKLLIRIAAVLLVPCLAGNALIPAGAATFGKQEAVLIADPAISALSTEHRALSQNGLGVPYSSLGTNFTSQALALEQVSDVHLRPRIWLVHRIVAGMLIASSGILWSQTLPRDSGHEQKELLATILESDLSLLVKETDPRGVDVLSHSILQTLETAEGPNVLNELLKTDTLTTPEKQLAQDLLRKSESDRVEMKQSLKALAGFSDESVRQEAVVNIAGRLRRNITDEHKRVFLLETLVYTALNDSSSAVRQQARTLLLSMLSQRNGIRGIYPYDWLLPIIEQHAVEWRQNQLARNSVQRLHDAENIARYSQAVDLFQHLLLWYDSDPVRPWYQKPPPSREELEIMYLVAAGGLAVVDLAFGITAFVWIFHYFSRRDKKRFKAVPDDIADKILNIDLLPESKEPKLPTFDPVSDRPHIVLGSGLSWRNAFRFPVQNRWGNWEVFKGGAILFIPILGWVWNLGYRSVMSHRMLKGEIPWPEWGNHKEMLRHGFITALAISVYAAVPALLLWIFAPSPLSLYAAATGFLAGIHMGPALGVSYSRQFSLRDLWISKWFPMMTRGSYWKAWGIAWSAFGISLLFLPSVIGFFFASVWVYHVSCYCFDSVYRDLQNELTTEPSKQSILVGHAA